MPRPRGAQPSSGTLLAPLSAPDELAVQQWGQRLLTLLDTGQPAADAAAFTFANPTFNGPLFSPVMASVRGVTDYTNDVVNMCRDDEELQPFGGMGSNVLTGSQPVRDYLAHGRLATQINQSAATFAHLQAIINNGVPFTIVGGTLVSEGLPPLEVHPHGEGGGGGGGDDGPQYATVAPATLAWVTQLAGQAMTLAGAQDQTHVTRDLLMGLQHPVEAFRWAVSGYADGTLNRPLTTYTVYGLFGTYGALPMVVAVYDDFSGLPGDDHRFFVLIDGVNGAIDGPFVSGTVIDPTNLLAGHAEASGMTAGEFLVVNREGCGGTLAATWQTDPPVPYIPRLPCPACSPPPLPSPVPPPPPSPFPVSWPPLDPRKLEWEGKDCNQGAAACACNVSGQGTSGGKLVFHLKSCSCPGGCPPPAGFTGCTCTDHYFH